MPRGHTDKAPATRKSLPVICRVRVDSTWLTTLLSSLSHSRARGNLKDINDRRCLNLSIVGEGGTVEGLPEHRGRNGSEESGIDLASPASDNSDVLGRFPPYHPQQLGSGNSSPAVAPQHLAVENGFVYPPRQERGVVAPPRPAAGSMSPAQLRHVRQSSQSSSTFSTHSSRASDGNNSGDGLPVYRRSNSGGNHSSNLPLDMLPPQMPASAGYAGMPDGEFIPPTDYEEDSFRQEPVAMRPKPFPAAVARRPASGSGASGPMLMRSLPTSVLQSEMSLHSPRNPRRAVDGDEYFFNADRMSQSVYASHNEVDFRPHSADYGAGGVRRVNSMYR